MDVACPTLTAVVSKVSEHWVEVAPAKLAWQDSEEGTPSTTKVTSTFTLETEGLTARTFRLPNVQLTGEGVAA